MKLIKVFLNNKDRSKPRIIVEAEFLKQNSKTIHVRLLHDNHVIERKIFRDLPEGISVYESEQ